MGTTALSPWVKRPGCQADHSPPSTAQVKIVELYLHFSTRLHGMKVNLLSPLKNIPLPITYIGVTDNARSDCRKHFINELGGRERKNIVSQDRASHISCTKAGQNHELYTWGMSNFKQVVIDFLVSKLPVMYHPLLSSYLALSKNIGKNNTTYDVCC
jgi:hypothetical protein